MDDTRGVNFRVSEGGQTMWINLFTIALAVAIACGTAALILQHREFQPAEPRRRRRVTRLRG